MGNKKEQEHFLAKTQRRREQQEEEKEPQTVEVKLALLSDFCDLSECSKRARERHPIICGQEFIARSKQQRALKLLYGIL
jgi:SepF-like predicted cell division protein (DUF552 family)